MTLNEIMALAVAKQEGGNLTDAQAICHQVLRQSPNQPHALNLLGVMACQLKQFEPAIAFFRRAILADPRQPAYGFNLGRLLTSLGQWHQAANVYRAILDISPNDFEALKCMARALHHSGRLREAETAYRAALALHPNDPAMLNNLGGVCGKAADAIDCFQRAIALQPEFALAYSNLSTAVAFQDRFDEAIRYARRAIDLDPGSFSAYNNLGHALFATAQHNQAIQCFRKSESLDPKNLGPSSNRLFCLQFHPDFDAAAILHECRLWDEQYARPVLPANITHANHPAADRKLRIGYLSRNFFQHSQAPFMVALLKNHDREQFDIFIYSDVVAPDATTNLIRSHATQWRDILAATDAQAAELIRNDRIDILVDLTMHMSRGRPLLFARKPAPIQVAYLAYPGTTGMAAMDYRFTDPHLDPPGLTDEFYSEKSLRLPETFACFDPEATVQPPPVSPLPAHANGFITFGSLNSFFKLNLPLMALWSRVLHAVPGSRLRLLAPEGDSRAWVMQYLPPDHVDFVSRMSRDQYLAEYSRIDICLDTLPYNGHTTSLESLFQGVPVVTRRGITAAGRVGFSLLHNLTLPELAAETDDQFVAIASGLANDLPRLLELRNTLRNRLLASPLTDAPSFARAVEAAYRRMASDWRPAPPHAHSAHALGEQANRLCQSGDFTAAIACYRQALAANPDHFQTQNNLASALVCIGQWEQAAQWYQRALALAPGSPDILRNIAKSFTEQNLPDQAIAALDKLLALHPDDALAHVHRGLALLLRGDYPNGFADYDWRWKAPQELLAFHPPGPAWDGSPLAGKRILLHAEQGLGDAIQFLRFAPEVAQRGGRIILALHSELRRIAEGIAPIDHWVLHGQNLPDYDLHCPLLGLPRALGLTLPTIPQTVPYLTASPVLSATWKSRLAAENRLKVGLVWSGHPRHANDRNRSLPLPLLAPLAKIASARFFSLQKGPAAAQAQDAPLELTDWTADLHDFADTAALIANLDLVICVDTAVAHLAGAMGKPTWLLLPYAPDWRWLLNRTDSPWYPTLRIFRQPKFADWPAVAEQLAQALPFATPM